MNSIFENYPNHLDKAYDLLLEDSFSKDYWKSGDYRTQRIKWEDAYSARKQLDKFHESGIYIWGYDEVPLYLGKAEKLPFSSRFSRYVFSSKSQCKIGEIYSERLKKGEKMTVKDSNKKSTQNLNAKRIYPYPPCVF